MKHMKIIKTLCLLLVISPFLITFIVEKKLDNVESIKNEVGYTIPNDAKIISTDASIWSLCDGNNYKWYVSSKSSLLSWAKSLGVLEYGSAYKVTRYLPEQIEETSYITLSEDNKSVVIETFRP